MSQSVTFAVSSPFCLSVAGHGLESTPGDKVRLFRAEMAYAVTQGKWYFEFEAVTTGEMRVGWARPSVHSDTELGADELAYVFNGNKVCPHQARLRPTCRPQTALLYSLT